MPATVLTAVAFVDADRRAIGFNAINRLEKLFIQLFDLFLGSNLFLIGRFRLCDNSLLLLDGILHLAVFLVHRVGEILDTEHIAMVSEGKAVHTVFLALCHQIGHLRHTVEHGIMRVDMQMGEMLRQIIAHFRHFFCFFLFYDRLKGDASGLNHLRIGGLEVLDKLGINA